MTRPFPVPVAHPRRRQPSPRRHRRPSSPWPNPGEARMLRDRLLHPRSSPPATRAATWTPRTGASYHETNSCQQVETRPAREQRSLGCPRATAPANPRHALQQRARIGGPAPPRRAGPAEQAGNGQGGQIPAADPKPQGRRPGPGRPVVRRSPGLLRRDEPPRAASGTAGGAPARSNNRRDARTKPAAVVVQQPERRRLLREAAPSARRAEWSRLTW